MISAAALSFWGVAATVSTAYAAPPRQEEIAYVSFQTGNGTASALRPTLGDQSSTAVEVRLLRERSGLSWQQVARLFGVSRRAVHMWASGSRMTDHHAELLGRHLEVVRKHDQGDAEATRQHLLAAGQGSRSPYQLMVDYQLRSREKPLRGELSAATLLEANEPTPLSATEVVRGGRRLGRAANRSVDGEPGSG
ncbi:helix-turn-helix domain-containing protein [Streptomyces tanashiensis]